MPSNNNYEDIGPPDDISSIISGSSYYIPKTAIFLFILFMMLSSDVFIDRILSNNKGYVEGRNCTLKGTIVQGLLLSLGYIILHLLIVNDIL